MALVWSCDRCERVSRMGNVDDPPDDWERRSMPVRGSQGARSSSEVVLCEECDDDLYRWLHGNPHPAPFGSASSLQRMDDPYEAGKRAAAAASARIETDEYVEFRSDDPEDVIRWLNEPDDAARGSADG